MKNGRIQSRIEVFLLDTSTEYLNERSTLHSEIGANG